VNRHEGIENYQHFLEGNVLEKEVNPSGGYGMKNVDSRLKLDSSQSEPRGTTIRIQVKESAMVSKAEE
jgi:hypothetical protein